MSEKRIIKKYPNRRLYDTAISSYITLDDVRKLLLEKVSVAVFDAKTNEDITRVTLMQIVCEQENTTNIFSVETLESLIQTHDGTRGQILREYLSKGLEVFNSKLETLPADVDSDQATARNTALEATKEWIRSFSQVAIVANLKDVKTENESFAHSTQ